MASKRWKLPELDNHGAYLFTLNIAGLVPLYICIALAFKNKYNVLIVFILYCKTLLQLLRWDTGSGRTILFFDSRCRYLREQGGRYI